LHSNKWLDVVPPNGGISERPHKTLVVDAILVGDPACQWHWPNPNWCVFFISLWLSQEVELHAELPATAQLGVDFR